MNKVDVELKNGYIMVKELVRKEAETTTTSGLILPESTLEDDQVSQGTILRSCVEGYKEGEVIFFHKTLPVDAILKFGDDTAPQEYIFLKADDVIAKVLTIVDIQPEAGVEFSGAQPLTP